MKFESRSQAEQFARMETNSTHRKHAAVPGRWQGPDLEWHDCWTVVLAIKEKRYGQCFRKEKNGV
jgi:hypothetical protein